MPTSTPAALARYPLPDVAAYPSGLYLSSWFHRPRPLRRRRRRKDGCVHPALRQRRQTGGGGVHPAGRRLLRLGYSTPAALRRSGRATRWRCFNKRKPAAKPGELFSTIFPIFPPFRIPFPVISRIQRSVCRSARFVSPRAFYVRRADTPCLRGVAPDHLAVDMRPTSVHTSRRTPVAGGGGEKESERDCY